jgi:hypothetical protein
MLQIAAIAQALEKPESADAVIDAPPRVRVRRL